MQPNKLNLIMTKTSVFTHSQGQFLKTMS